MSEEKNPGPNIPPATEVLLPQSNDVSLEGVEQKLIEYAVHLGYVHWLLFGTPAVVLHARDTAMECSPLHAGGLAIDLYTQDLQPDEELLFASIVHWSAPARRIVPVFELWGYKVRHIHLELRA